MNDKASAPIVFLLTMIVLGVIALLVCGILYL